MRSNSFPDPFAAQNAQKLSRPTTDAYIIIIPISSNEMKRNKNKNAGRRLCAAAYRGRHMRLRRIYDVKFAIKQ